MEYNNVCLLRRAIRAFATLCVIVEQATCKSNGSHAVASSEQCDKND